MLGVKNCLKQRLHYGDGSSNKQPRMIAYNKRRRQLSVNSIYLSLFFSEVTHGDLCCQIVVRRTKDQPARSLRFDIGPCPRTDFLGFVLGWHFANLLASMRLQQLRVRNGIMVREDDVKTIPLSKISSVYYGYAKPWKTALVIGLLGVALGLSVYATTQNVAASALISSFFWGLAIAYYLLNKDFSLGVCEVGGILSGVDFRRSLIEGVTVDEEAAEKVHLIVQALIERTNVKHSP